MGRLFRRKLDHPTQIFCCKRCGTQLVDANKLISNSFHGRCGKAILVSGVINVYFMRAEERQLMTGLHIVRDVHCVQCHENVGWTYDYAAEERERYKIENFVLERELLVLKKQYSIDDQYTAAGEPPSSGDQASSARGTAAGASAPSSQQRPRISPPLNLLAQFRNRVTRRFGSADNQGEPQ